MPVPKVMREVIRLYVQIALLRRGPQDLPASRLLLILTVCGYAAVNALVSSLLPPSTGWPPQLAIDVLFTLAWYAALLQLTGRSERFLQTATAVFGFQAVLSPLLIGSEWLMRRFGQDTTWQLPIAVAALALVIWLIAANSHVVKAALDWSSATSVALVILQIVASELLLFALFPPGA
ncbi:MAG TPA: hypothetical protein VLV25_02135 [Steroidobacteraceae bacterium]|nr:hypothetical protein [Steroidobacteraceae bacterium]